ncbi:MAG: hypothetical protein B7Z36_04450 [Novosphingobium sp. 12-63-9]|nr:MAG: hypothetical protein B7Z36_04450 [Novosphingobium sp. 12-63-9]
MSQRAERDKVRVNIAVKIISFGDSAAIVLPDELLAHFGAGVGDTLHVTAVPGGLRLTTSDPAFAENLAVADRIIAEDRGVLGKLAE